MSSKINKRIVDAGCQICHSDFTEHVIDGRTKNGPWAYMCEDCHTEIGCGLGTGKGQKYSVETLEKVEG